MTAEELLRRPDDHMRHELVRGELTTMSPVWARQSWIAGRLVAHLGHYVHERRLGVVGTGGGFVLARNPDTVRAPNIALLRADRYFDTWEYFPGAPDLAIDVISPIDSSEQIEAQVEDCLRSGTQIFIVVDSETDVARIHTPTRVRHLTVDDSLDGGDVVPGWTLPLRELFA